MADHYTPLDAAPSASVLSIGALSKATGVPTDTLRTWERRYGFPHPLDRPDSGHRRYPLSTVEKIRLVVKALDMGHKPSVVLRADVDTLRELLSIHDGPLVVERDTEAHEPGDFEEWFAHVESFDGEALAHSTERAFNQMGALNFLCDCLGPFVSEIGVRWEQGRLEVAHEHFAVEHLRQFLSARWRPLSAGGGATRIVCATLPGEQHVIGLHMAALTIALANCQIVFLGSSTPVADIARVVVDRRASAVALSASVAAEPRDLSRDVAQLRRTLAKEVPIVVGGQGFENVVAEVLRKPDLRDLNAWASQFAVR